MTALSALRDWLLSPAGLAALGVLLFILITIALASVVLKIVRAVRGGGKARTPSNDPTDPLERAAKPAKSRGAIGLARLREATTARFSGTAEPRLGKRRDEREEDDESNEPTAADAVRGGAAVAAAPAASAASAVSSVPVASAPVAPTASVAPEALPAVRLGDLLLSLPFRPIEGLTTGHANFCGMSIEAVFFPGAVNGLANPVERIVPFLPPEACTLLFKESDRATFRAGDLFAQPDAVIRIPGGLVSVEYKSKGGRNDDPERWAEQIREKDLLQAVVNALVLSAETQEPVAAILRTHNAAYFLRPTAELKRIVECSVEPACVMLRSAGNTRIGIGAADLAGMLAVTVSTRWPKPRHAGHEAGEAAHREMLDRQA